MKKKKLLATLLAAGMLFSAFPATTSAEAVQKTVLGKTAVRTAADEWEVKLALPALEIRPSADVVLVMDVSSSMKETDIQEAKAAAIAMCDELAKKQNVDVQVGVVTFDRDAQVVSQLTGDLESVKTKINTITAKADTNMVAGLMKGKEMLDQSSADDQYLVLLSDGIPICWMEDGRVTNKTWHHLNDHIEGTPEVSSFQAGNEINQGNADNPRKISSAQDLLTIEQLFEKAAEIESDSKHIYASINTGYYLKQGDDSGAYYTNLEAATYHTAKYIRDELAGENANLITVAYGMDKYAGQNAIHYDYGAIFCKWIGEQSDQYYEVGKAGYDGEPGDLANVFSQIADETIKLIDRGTVTDTIGTGYDLAQNDGVTPFVLTKGIGSQAITYEGVLLEEGCYGFSKNENSYDYIINYEKQADGSEVISWKINVPITKEAPVCLSYRIILSDSIRSNGLHTKLNNMRNTVDETPVYNYSENTNNSAVLDSVDTNGNVTAEKLPFPVPNGEFETGVLVVEHIYDNTISGDPLNLPGPYVSLPVITDWSQDYSAQFFDVENLSSLAEGEYVVSNITVTMPNGKTTTYYTEKAFIDAVVNENGVVNADTRLTKITYTYTYQPVSSEPSESDSLSSSPSSEPSEPSNPSSSINNGESSESGPSSLSSKPSNPSEPSVSVSEQPNDIPSTGGNVSSIAWIMLMLAAAAGFTGIALHAKKKKA